MDPNVVSPQLASRRSLIILAIILLGFISNQILLGGLPTTRLGSAPALSGIASIALQSPASGSALPVVNQDYKMTTHYFDNNQWVVLSLSSPNNSFDPSIVVAQNKNGVYQIRLGPSGALTSSQLTTVPGDVAAYLLEGGGIYQTIPE